MATHAHVNTIKDKKNCTISHVIDKASESGTIARNTNRFTACVTCLHCPSMRQTLSADEVVLCWVNLP